MSFADSGVLAGDDELGGRIKVLRRDRIIWRPLGIELRIVPAEHITFAPGVFGAIVQYPDTGGAVPDLSVDGTIELERLPEVVYMGRPAFGQEASTVGIFKVDPVTNEATVIAARAPRGISASCTSVKPRRATPKDATR